MGFGRPKLTDLNLEIGTRSGLDFRLGFRLPKQMDFPMGWDWHFRWCLGIAKPMLMDFPTG